MFEEGGEAARNLERGELSCDIVRGVCFLGVVRTRQGQLLEIPVGDGAAEPLGDQAHGQRGIRADDRRHHHGRIGRQRGGTFLHMMPQSGKHLRHVAHGAGDLRIDGISIGRFVGEEDPQLAGLTRDLFRIGALRRWRDVGAGGFRSLDRVQHRRAIANADADDVIAGKTAPAFAAIGTERRAGSRRLQTEYPGSRCRDPDRSATVAGVSDREDARCDCRRGAAG